MIKKISTLLTLGLAASILVACSNKEETKSQSNWEKVEKAGVLKVATPGTLYPTSYYNDDKELIGYEIDMLNEIGDRLDIDIDYQEIG
ncbi:transporter substrate-binding domain-containing protein, partial [Streptococcus hyovaginalis]